MRKRTIIKIAMVIAISLCCGKSYVKNIKAETAESAEENETKPKAKKAKKA